MKKLIKTKAPKPRETDWTMDWAEENSFGKLDSGRMIERMKKAKVDKAWAERQIPESAEKKIEEAKTTPVTKKQKGQNRDALEIARLEEEKRQNPDIFSKAKQKRFDKLRKRQKK